MPRSARAQLYVSQIGPLPNTGNVEEYNAITGAAINANFITRLNGPAGLALSGNNLFVANDFSTTVGAYDASTGVAINPSFITGLSGAFGLLVKHHTLLGAGLVIEEVPADQGHWTNAPRA
jgi:hypothetical protein